MLFDVDEKQEKKKTVEDSRWKKQQNVWEKHNDV